jgi:hypothetical protein
MTLREVSQEIAAVKEQQAAIQHTQMLILDELRLMRCGAGRIDADSLEALLEYLHDEFHESTWTSRVVFEQAAENRLLRAALIRCLGEEGTANGLGKLLKSHLGRTGEFLLVCVKKHGSSGAVFRVTDSVTSSLL